MDGLDVGGVVADKVIVQLNTARFLRLNDDVADLEEDTLDLRVVVVESLGAIDRTRALVGLKYDQEFLDKLLTLSHQVLLIQVNAHVVLSLEDLEADNIGRLLLVEVLGEDVGSLSVSLAPLLRFSVE